MMRMQATGLAGQSSSTLTKSERSSAEEKKKKTQIKMFLQTDRNFDKCNFICKYDMLLKENYDFMKQPELTFYICNMRNAQSGTGI